MSTAVIAHETIDLIVAALRTKWLRPNPAPTPTASPGLNLDVIHASCDEPELYGRHIEVLLVPDGKKKPKSKRNEGTTRKIETRPRVMQDEMPAVSQLMAKGEKTLKEKVA